MPLISIYQFTTSFYQYWLQLGRLIQQQLVQSEIESENTKNFIKYLLSKNKGSRIAIIWDGASYHNSKEIKEYLKSVNDGLEEAEWKVTCLKFAPNCPQQNPMEDIWLQGKKFIR